MMSSKASYLCLCIWIGLFMVLVNCGYFVERDALMAFKSNLDDPDNVLESWQPHHIDPCPWVRVTCDSARKVSSIDLGNTNLSGNLVPDLAKLEHLQYLELYRNNIQGTIPSEFGTLKNLISLDLYNNNMSGSIPPELGNLKSLVFLRLNNNQFTGPIPTELIKLSNLKVLDVSTNNLCGTIPTTGVFESFPMECFENNPRLEGPQLLGLASYDTNCV